MEKFWNYVEVLGRILLISIFVMSGLQKLGDIQGNMAYVTSGGLPGFMLFPAIAIELFASLAILLGWKTRIAALLLAVFCLMSGLMFHGNTFPDNAMATLLDQIHLMKNIALTGAFLFLAGRGAGPISLDNRNKA
ncbi:DoxX family protein [Gynuella sunshinyii]|uniref:Putative membrane protein n=1 Tax=Gynuella sunshinyii YC6258 TaxID=1445510 RepID=A0A0C5VH76_9GAMM|nr:DoxX family protein [Gynuella sunshinyii]AJQ93596.1 putative membrane protein [Gynuella sunshinyii YC6258]